MNVIKKILSYLVNPLTMIFKWETPVDTNNINKHQFVIGVITLIIVCAVMCICYFFVFK